MKNRQLSRKVNKTAQRLFNSPDGLIFLAALRRSMLLDSVVGTDSHQTYYKVGQEDFVKMLLEYTNDELLDDINILDSGMQDELNY